MKPHDSRRSRTFAYVPPCGCPAEVPSSMQLELDGTSASAFAEPKAEAAVFRRRRCRLQASDRLPRGEQPLDHRSYGQEGAPAVLRSLSAQHPGSPHTPRRPRRWEARGRPRTPEDRRQSCDAQPATLPDRPATVPTRAKPRREGPPLDALLRRLHRLRMHEGSSDPMRAGQRVCPVWLRDSGQA